MGESDPQASCEVAVVGAGAAGLTAAIFAAERAPRGARVVLLERAPRIGAKLLISGGGRCNVTHERVSEADFNGARVLVRRVLAGFDERAVQRWFAELGVRLKCEPGGKLFPQSDRAATVVDALVARCRALGVEIRVGCRIDELERRADGFWLRADGGEWRSQRVVLATGGRSLPRTGSDGLGWRLATGLGHTLGDTFPALVPLVLDGGFFHARLAGVAQPVELSVFGAGKLRDRRCGSLLFTHFGISGPVVLDASRHWLAAERAGEAPRLVCNWLPGMDFAAIEGELLAAAGSQARKQVRRWLAGWLAPRLAEELAALADCGGATVGELTRERRRRLVHALSALELPVVRARGWDFAEVTAGGVPLAEVDTRSMQSRRVAGLYLTGEMLDVDGRIGGFNFQWAWSTGHLAGVSAGSSLGAGVTEAS